MQRIDAVKNARALLEKSVPIPRYVLNIALIAAISTLASLVDTERVVFAQGRTGKSAAAQEAMTQASAALGRGDRKAAEVLLRRAIDLGQLAIAYERYSMLLFAQKRFKEGVQVTEQGLRHHSQSAALIGNRGAHLFGLGRVTEAYRDLKRVASERQTAFATQAVTAQCCARVGDYQCARQAVDNYLAHRPSALKVRDASFRLVRATASVRLGELQNGEKELREVLRRGVSRAATRLQAEILLARGAAASAVSKLEPLIKKGEDLETVWVFGRALLAAKQNDRALNQARAYLAKRPGERKGLSLVAEAQRAVGKLEASLASYKELAKQTESFPGLAPTAADISLRVARVQLQKGQPKAAMNALKPLLRDKPNDAALQVAMRALRPGQPEPALAMARRAAKSSSDFETRLQAARLMLDKGRPSEALAVMRSLLTVRKDSYAVRSGLRQALLLEAAAAFQQGALGKAKAALQAAKKVMSGSLILRRNLAFIALRESRYQDAVNELMPILSKVPQDIAANWLVARAYVGLKQLQKAITHIEKVRGQLPESAKSARLQTTTALAEVQIMAKRYRAAAKTAGEVLRRFKKKERKTTAVGKLEEVHARALLGVALSRRSRAAVQRDIRIARRLLKRLPAEQRAPLEAIAAVASIARGDVRVGAKLLRRTRRSIGQAVAPKLKRVAMALLSAYADYRSANLRTKQRGANRLLRLSKALQSPHRQRVLALVQSASEQIASVYYRRNNYRAATRAYQQAMRLLQQRATAQQKHNAAVLSYRRNPAAAIAVLRKLRTKVPLATCNLAVHLTAKGKSTQAFGLFKTCQAQGAPYPGVKSIVESYQRVQRAFQ
jgi:tetratricopeptide (TPR) repeat protein